MSKFTKSDRPARAVRLIGDHHWQAIGPKCASIGTHQALATGVGVVIRIRVTA